MAISRRRRKSISEPEKRRNYWTGLGTITPESNGQRIIGYNLSLKALCISDDPHSKRIKEIKTWS